MVKFQIKKTKTCLELQTAEIVNVDLQLLKAVNKGHINIVLTDIIVIMISTINNCDKQIDGLKTYNLLWQTDGLKTYNLLWQTDGLKTGNLLLLFKEIITLRQLSP